MNIYTVTEITKYLKTLFETNKVLTKVYISGEISNFKLHSSGHCYFTIKDSQATLKSVMFKSKAQYLKFKPYDGLKVVILGQITIFERDGQYQLYAEHMFPEGAGELSLAYEQLKNKLSEEGLFDENRKKKIPIFPKAVGIVTSSTGAAIKDIITVAKRRHPGIALLLCPVKVQGEDAAGQIAKGIEILNKDGRAEVIIIGRGGGSIEELWSFNEEIVIRSIVSSKIPIISAVGHETDFTLADFAADKRAATPSQAAEIAVPNVDEYKKYIKTLDNILVQNVQKQIKFYRKQLMALQGHSILTNPEIILRVKMQEFDDLRERLNKSTQVNLEQKKNNLTVLTDKLSILNPLATMARGYALVYDEKNVVLKSIKQLKIKQKIRVELNDGKIEGLVTEIIEEAKS